MHTKSALTKAQRRAARKALEEAIDKVGGPTKVGKIFGIKSQAVSQWEICPKDNVLGLAAESGVSATRLRPDHYPVGTVLPACASA